MNSPATEADVLARAKRFGPEVAAVAVYFGLWALFGLKAALFFSLGFISASLLAAWEIGARKARATKDRDAGR